MEEKTLFAERIELFDNALNIRHNKRTPFLSNFWTWKILDSDYTLREALYDYDVMERLVCEFHERYQFDTYLDLGTRNLMRVARALGAGIHQIDDVTEAIVVDDHKLMEREEYPELSNDPICFLWEKILARFAPDLTLQKLRDGSMEFAAYAAYGDKMKAKFTNEYQVPMLDLQPSYLPFEYFFNGYRGIKEMSIDLRKSKSELKDACEALYQTLTLPVVNQVVNNDPSVVIADSTLVMLGHSILSEKQFGEFYWPHLKDWIDIMIKHNRRLHLFCESSMARYVEFFKDIPKGVVSIHLEQDNIFDLKKQLPNICFVGGMTSDLLGNGTPQQCVDYAKKLIDELGDGFIFSTNKMMSFRNDCKRENLLAVSDFVRNYNH